MRKSKKKSNFLLDNWRMIPILLALICVFGVIIVNFIGIGIYIAMLSKIVMFLLEAIGIIFVGWLVYTLIYMYNSKNKR